MAVINLLDVQTSNLIAAGEVVERPANVLKELLENAIDAKSTAIVTEITGGGVESIRVTDNGCGMDKEDLPLSIRRHATSKIKTGADLATISTLGFRGEALAAISSTSRFTVMSKMRDAAFGHQMTVEGEEILSLEECGCADGTTVIVQDLFFNQPARRKFLKRAQTESAAILQYIQRIAVSHPEIAFRHSADGAVKLQTIGNGKLGDCIYSVYGKEFASSLVEVDYKEGPFFVKGYITRPEMARNNHNYQSFYINSRYVKSRTMQFAMEDAYKSFVKSEKFPGCVLFLDIDPGEVDVNVHPAKLEVRFSDERGVYSAVFAAVRKTLSSLSNRLAKENYERAVLLSREKKDVVVPKISETRPPLTPSVEVKAGTFHETKKELPLFSPAPSRGKSVLIKKEERPIEKTVTVKEADFTKEEISQTIPKAEPVPEALEDIPAKPEEETFTQGTVIGLEELAGAVKKGNPLTELGSVRGVVFNAFILYETKEKLYLIDKHAAHERILYESLKKEHKSESVQLFLEPISFRLSPVDAAAVRDHLEELTEAGFLLEEFGDTGFLLRGIPLEFTSLSGDAIISILESAASELRLGGKAAGAGEKKFDRTLYSMACKAAVKAGIPSTKSDHEWIVEKIREIDNIIVCPHGRPILVAYTKKEIENLFLRT